MRKSWDWEHFYQRTKDKPPSLGLVKAVSLLGHADDALDFGCGAGRDTRYLLAQGFSEPFTMVLAGALLHSFPPE